MHRRDSSARSTPDGPTQRRMAWVVGWFGAVLLGGCSPGPLDIATIDSHSPLFGLVAHWPFDDGAGAIATDRSGHSHDGTIVGGTWISGRFGGALHLNAGDEITVPWLQPQSSGFTVALWVRPPAGDFGETYLTLISTEVVFRGGWEMNMRITPADTRYQFGYWHGPGLSDYFTYECRCVTAQAWTHIAGVVDSTAGVLSFYRDGIYQGQTVVTEPIRPGSPTLYVGRWQMPGRLLTGDVDDIVIYDRVLGAPEVKALFDAPAPIPP